MKRYYKCNKCRSKVMLESQNSDVTMVLCNVEKCGGYFKRISEFEYKALSYQYPFICPGYNTETDAAKNRS